ncbi:MAG: hypothetical protein IT270_10480 [Saprospiraceae bacterium]|nr:hypothetical protein [Saprospiraceae bacterium]
MRTIILLLLASSLHAQRLVHHDLLLLDLTAGPTVSKPRLLTGFNPKGYNNQPYFFGNSELYLTVQMPQDTTQTDIYALDLVARTQTRVTATPGLSEYSPTPMPDKKRFSTVRVEADGRQRLWSFPKDRSDNGRPEYPDVYGVGYHAWMSDTLIAMFIVGEPHSLVVADKRSGKPIRIGMNPGRCLVALSATQLAYVQKATEQTWYLKIYDHKRKSSDILVKTIDGSEDFAVLSDGSFVAGSGSKLYKYMPGVDKEWKMVADLSGYGVGKITRLAVSPDGGKLVVVY